jgi:hypothetical protein
MFAFASQFGPSNQEPAWTASGHERWLGRMSGFWKENRSLKDRLGSGIPVPPNVGFRATFRLGNGRVGSKTDREVGTDIDAA